MGSRQLLQVQIKYSKDFNFDYEVARLWRIKAEIAEYKSVSATIECSSIVTESKSETASVSKMFSSELIDFSAAQVPVISFNLLDCHHSQILRTNTAFTLSPIYV